MPYSFESVYFDKKIIKGRVMDIFMPDKISRKKAMFFVHGGGWHGGSRANYHALMAAFNREGFICAATDYRLEGVNILCQLTDVRHGFDIFTGMLVKQNFAPEGVFVHGSSAGGHLAALLTMAKPGECGEKDTFGEYTIQYRQSSPIGASLQSAPLTFEPWEDIFPHVLGSMSNIAGVSYEANPDLYRKVSPVQYISKDTPPLLLLGAENEHMFPLEHNIALIKKAQRLGCRVEHKLYTKAEHGFFYDVTRRQQKEAFADIISFIESI